MGVLECAVLAVALQAALATPQYGAGPSRPQKVWTTTPFPDEVPPANNDVYQPPPPQYKPQPSYQPQPQPSYQPQPQPSYQPQPQNAGQGAPPSGGSYWWASGSRPFSPEATGQASAPQPSAPVVSPGNPFLGGGRPQQPQALPQQPSGGGGYGGGAPAGPPQTPAYDIPCSQPGQVCVGLGQCQGGYVAPGANAIRQGQCSSASQTCCQQRPQQPQYQPPPPQTGGYGQPPPAQIPRPQPPPPSYGGGYSQPQPNYQPQPTPGPYTGPLNTTPYPGCAAALKCVEETYCTAEGVMANSPQYLTREQQENRVPMSDCQNPETGIIGKCCRDPNYKDPWPGGMMMKNMPGSAPSGPGPVAPPPPPPPARQGGFQDTCANSGGVCVPSQQCPAQSRMQPEQDCTTLTSGQPGKCCSYAVNTVSGGGGGGGGDGYGK